MWTGIGVLITILVLISQMEVVKGRLESLATNSLEADNATQGMPAPTGQVAPTQINFSVEKRVRCPGGGDWLGRERNKRSATIAFKAPAGRWIKAAEIKVIAKHYGRHSKVKYDQSTVAGEMRRTRAHAEISCDPPDYPGAPGGWMEVRLKSK